MQAREVASVEQAVEAALAAVGKRMVLGAPIGIGKPNQLINAFYRRAVADPTIDLTLFTALSLERPRAHSDVEQRLLGPFVERVFGNYEELDYMAAIRADRLPANIKVHEFYFRAGSMQGVKRAQRDYVSSNYTFALRDLLDRGMNVMLQLVASAEVDGRPMLSLSSNTDIALDLLAAHTERRARGEPCITIAQIHGDMPFMFNRAMIEPERFDVLVRNTAYDTTLFAPPNQAVGAVDHAIGLHASALIRDGGTLQIGIGSLGDAIAHACRLRHRDNAAYARVLEQLGCNAELVQRVGGLGRFEQGLYGCSEMFVNGFLHLIEAGIIRREVYDDAALQRLANCGELRAVPDERLLQALCDAGAIGPALSEADVQYLQRWGIFAADVEWRHGVLWRNGQSCAPSLQDEPARRALSALALGNGFRGGICMHGGFFLGPRDFYQRLRELPREQADRIGMDSVRCINRLDDPPLRALQRRDARFMNSAMMVTLTGAVVSDALENGQIVSGVGGQYNFVAQAHELPDARAIICLRATRSEGGDVRSNIVPRYGHVTLPRHLRDIVVTEYGAADLRGRSDEEIIHALLNIADSRCQPQLHAAAVAAGKIDPAYRIPAQYCSNLPQRIAAVLADGGNAVHFPAYPFGSDFSPEEIALVGALRKLAALRKRPAAMLLEVLRAFAGSLDQAQAKPCLERMGLGKPHGWRERVLQRLLLRQLQT